MDDLRLVLLALGMAGFCVTLYLAIRHPHFANDQQSDLEEVAAGGAVEASKTGYDRIDWRMVDKVATWLMWGGWLAAGVVTFLIRNKDMFGIG